MILIYDANLKNIKFYNEKQIYFGIFAMFRGKRKSEKVKEKSVLCSQKSAFVARLQRKSIVYIKL